MKSLSNEFLGVVILFFLQHLPERALSSPSSSHDSHSHHSPVAFKKSCDPSQFSMTSPETIIPQVSTKSRPSNEEILIWYEKGLQECKDASLNKSTGFLKDKVGPPLMNVELNRRNNDCRGNAMLYQITGLMVWPFGPIDQCPINSECWFGYLVCGHFEKEKVTKLFSSGPRLGLVQAPDFDPSWSIRSLDITTRIVGLESLVPMISYVNLTTRTLPVEILLAQYTLTIPGDYTIEMRLQGFYPGLLHQWKPSVLRKGVEMYHSVFLGGCEGRCPPYNNCGPYNIPACDVKSFVGNSPYRMKSSHRVVECHNSAPHFDGHLPFCKSGNNPGRWIRIPESVIEVCGIAKYEKDLYDERKRQEGKRQEFGKYSAISTAYAAHTQHVSPEKMWESVKEINPQAHANDKSYLETLQRYSGGNICSLAAVEGPLTPLDGKLEVFAPYDCRYHLFSSAQVTDSFSLTSRHQSFLSHITGCSMFPKERKKLHYLSWRQHVTQSLRSLH
jgi:hypothetical protein